MYDLCDVRRLVAALPADLRSNVIRINAQYDILGDANRKMGWHNKVLEGMADELFNQLCALIREAIALMPEEIQNEQPTEDGEYIMQSEVEFLLRRM